MGSQSPIQVADIDDRPKHALLQLATMRPTVKNKKTPKEPRLPESRGAPQFGKYKKKKKKAQKSAKAALAFVCNEIFVPTHPPPKKEGGSMLNIASDMDDPALSVPLASLMRKGIATVTGDRRVLVIDANGDAIFKNGGLSYMSICDARMFIGCGQASVVQCFDGFGENDNILFPPSIIKLKSVAKQSDLLGHRFAPVTRYNVFLRDDFKCAYCGKQLNPFGNGLTIDHVIPQMRGGVDSWMNMVTSCKDCNAAKGHSIPQNAPFVPKHMKHNRLERFKPLLCQLRVLTVQEVVDLTLKQGPLIHAHWAHFSMKGMYQNW